MADSWEDREEQAAPKPKSSFSFNPGASSFTFSPGASSFVPGGAAAPAPPPAPAPPAQPAAPAPPPPPAAAPEPPTGSADGAPAAADKPAGGRVIGLLVVGGHARQAQTEFAELRDQALDEAPVRGAVEPDPPAVDAGRSVFDRTSPDA